MTTTAHDLDRGGGKPDITYLQVHMYITLPVLALLFFVCRPFLHKLDTIKLVFLSVLAFTYTTPWDNWIVARGAWSYCPQCIVAAVGYVPVEEYAFFVIQALSAALWTTLVFLAGPTPIVVLAKEVLGRKLGMSSSALSTTVASVGGDQGSNQDETQEGSSHLASLLAHAAAGSSSAVNETGSVLSRITFTGGLQGTVLAAVWYWSLMSLAIPGTPTFYMGAIIAWTTPVLALQWILAGSYIWAAKRRAAVAVLGASAYLVAVDWIALGAGSWSISPEATLGWMVAGRVPIEEAVFFLLTNCMLVGGFLTCDRAFSVAHVRRQLATASSLDLADQRQLWLGCVLTTTSALAADPDVIKRLGDALVASSLIARGSKSFHLASLLYPWDLRAHIHAIYAFCRVTDDITDAPWLLVAARKRKLDVVRAVLVRSFDAQDQKQSTSPAGTAEKKKDDDYNSAAPNSPRTRTFNESMMADLTAEQISAVRGLCSVHDQYRVPVDPFLGLLDGYTWDLDARVIETVADVLGYSRLVAGTVGEMTTHLMVSGQSLAFTGFPARADDRVLAPAIELGVSMQLLNIARDILADARLGRMYVPRDFWPARASFSRAALAARLAARDLSPADHTIVHAAALDLVGLANSSMARAVKEGVPRLPRDARAPVVLAARVYGAIGDVLREKAAAHLPYPERAVVGRRRKLWELVRVLYL
ncbi:Squalene/phytoene synthase-domain-containing protein [Blastocladiella britannica]|nr:Squalene/phytoene synthase-domain-containing protein [Blastocladiella britannica]